METELAEWEEDRSKPDPYRLPKSSKCIAISREEADVNAMIRCYLRSSLFGDGRGGKGVC